MFEKKEKTEVIPSAQNPIGATKLGPSIGFIFSKQELEIILNYMGKRPWVEVTDIMDMIRMKLGKPKIIEGNGDVTKK